MSKRPDNEEEFQEREATGVIRASRFVREYARTHKPITMETVCEIHKEIFRDAWFEIAGIYRDENLEITDSSHLPPHHSEVRDQMNQEEVLFLEKLKKLKSVEGIRLVDEEVTDEISEQIDHIVTVAAWIHHTITHIHPFREGNGRVARLAANLILERHGLIGISIKIEKENKNRYRKALAQIDKAQDYEPLESIIYEGLIDRYDGVSMKYYSE